ncbi:glycosyl transferase family 41 protein [Nitzschia inconspicua]|uniref:Glycosyl transferase family 41 protein n=1 Tax=Nitzschia inconspicua TaxID=303405 RepID=A0A9K3KTU8_9STRA|nr:glycosyl transferase family 41 protein [Nitzschia inconspicua]
MKVPSCRQLHGQQRQQQGRRRRCRSITSSSFRLVTMILSLLFTTTSLLLAVTLFCIVPIQADSVFSLTTDGPESLIQGKKLYEEGDYDRAALYFWRAVLLQSSSPSEYTVEEAYQGFMGCFAVQDRMVDGFLFIAKESMQRKQKEMALQYIDQALLLEPDNKEALFLKERFETGGAMGSGQHVPPIKKRKERDNKFQPQWGTPEASNPLMNKSPEDLYEYGATLFSRKNYEHAADVFELSCKRSDYTLGPACANAVYCRMMIMDWGFNGTGFDADMARLEELTENEALKWRRGDLVNFSWQRATSVHPHMMLGYPLPPILKRYVAESVAWMDELMARVTDQGNAVNPLPEDLPFDPQSEREKYIEEAAQPGFKLKVGFVGSGFNSKAVLFLSQDIFRFYDRNKIEMHIFSLGPPDNDNFIKIGMGGVDWRKRVAEQVDHFHDIEEIKMDHIALARFIHEQGIHILIEWDGYARQGERAQGLMTLRPCPLQILHQEFLGTSGGTYVDYIVTDKVVSPPHLAHLYTEKFLYLPNHFFSKGHAVQKEVKKPTYDYLPASNPYEIGTGSPQENACLSTSPHKPKFVFCNFNKFLKNSPDTVRSWIRILREVPDSMLCLLENPKSGVSYLKRFVHEAAGTPKLQDDGSGRNKVPSFEPKDGDSLVQRIGFLPWERNPFDHQARNQDFCNLMLDSWPYNGHTVAQDALYGGVPIVTRSDGDDMSSRVTTSANIVLGLEELNAYEGLRQYEDIAIELGTNPSKYNMVRRKLIDTALQKNPMHPYWDAARYVRNLETGLIMAWERFLSGQPADVIEVVESEETARGTYEDFLQQNPSDRIRHDEL